jgi:hypothetical protein
MSNQNNKRAAVRRTPILRRAVGASVARLDAIVGAGTACQEVQASPTAKQALADLEAAVGAVHGSLSERDSLASQLRAAGQTLKIGVRAASQALFTYEAAVSSLAQGNAAIINGAGLPSETHQPPAPLGTVTGLRAVPGKSYGEAVLRWPAAKGATGYAVEVCFTPEDPSPSYALLGTASARHRMVKAPAPGAQLLARVAAVASDGTQSAWSDPVLAIAR